MKLTTESTEITGAVHFSTSIFSVSSVSSVVSHSESAHDIMSSNILPLRPNYTIADFAPEQVVTLRCTGRGGVPRYMHGDRAVVVRVTTSRIVLRNTMQQGAEVRALPEQVECIIDEGGAS